MALSDYTEKRIKTLTSRSGVRMVISQVTFGAGVPNGDLGYDYRNGYRVYTKDEYDTGKGYRYPEFDGIEKIEEALSQAVNY